MIRRTMTVRMLIAAGLLAVAGALAGCGFRPLYGEGSAGSAAELADIYIESIPDRAGQKLHNMLLERINPHGPPARPDWRLIVRLSEAISELALRRDERATRANLTVRASITLVPANPKDRRVFSALATSTNSYNRLQSDYATLAAEEDARDRALRTLAEDIRLRVAAALENPASLVPVRTQKPKPPPPHMAPAESPLDSTPLLPVP